MEKKSNNQLFWCTHCVSMSTRPRIKFDARGWCNACLWTEKKNLLDWSKRVEELKQLLSKHKRTDGKFDCLVPVSGGKDGSYVAYNLKHKFEDVTHQLRKKFEGSKHDLEETYEEMVSNMSYKTEDVINFLETKLADLKEQNSKLQKKQIANHEN